MSVFQTRIKEILVSADSFTCWILRDEDVEVPPDLLLAHAAGLHDRLHVILPQHGLAVAGAHHCLLVLQKVASELHPKVRNHGEGPY